jgi:hypothetical protein
LITDLDIWRCANLLLKRHGGEAVFIATHRADAVLDRGDPEGCRAWRRTGAQSAGQWRHTALGRLWTHP